MLDPRAQPNICLAMFVEVEDVGVKPINILPRFRVNLFACLEKGECDPSIAAPSIESRAIKLKSRIEGDARPLIAVLRAVIFGS